MIINADSLLPHLNAKVRPMQSDTSRHLICPHCTRRTRLNILADGRRKCTACGKKFRIHKMTDKTKLQQCAEILLCFCLDFSPRRASEITHHRYRLVAVFYDHFRRLIAEFTKQREMIPLPMQNKGDINVVHDKARCRWCKNKIRAVTEGGAQSQVFGVQFLRNGEVSIDPLNDDEAILHFHTFGPKGEAPGHREGFAGFICCGKFHRCSRDEGVKDGADQMWAWMLERERDYPGIWKRNTDLYLKEIAWKYNHRSLEPEHKAKKIIDSMPMNFLTSWVLGGPGKTVTDE